MYVPSRPRLSNGNRIFVQTCFHIGSGCPDQQSSMLDDGIWCPNARSLSHRLLSMPRHDVAILQEYDLMVQQYIACGLS